MSSIEKKTDHHQIICFGFVVLLTVLICVFLGHSAHYINFWPTDSQNPYIPTAAQLFKKPYLSQMHLIPVEGMLRLTMHAKEALIVGIAVMQRVLGDYVSLYPNVLLLIYCSGFSSLLVYLITKRFFNHIVGLFSFLLFIFCFWPYLYVLQGAHQPLSLMNFLFAVFFLQCVDKKRFFYFLSGLFLGFMFFSSPTSPLYAPYYLALFVYVSVKKYLPVKNFKEIVKDLFIFFTGLLFVFFIFTMPDPVWSINSYIEFLRFSQTGNNFSIYQYYLSQFFHVPEGFRGAGWDWIIKYFFFITPFIFTGYILSIIYLLKKSIRQPSHLVLIVLSLTTPFCVEFIKVAQFGRNYFPWIVGLVGLTSYALYDLRYKVLEEAHPLYKKVFLGCVVLFLSGHIIFNIHTFVNDIFPARMATTKIHDWCIKHGIKKLYVHRGHPLEKNFYWFLTNPRQTEYISLEYVDTIREASDGYFYLAPVTGKTILVECRMDDFNRDPYLTRLLISGEMEKYTVASFKSMASSRIWNMEEEICAYRDLSLGQVRDEDRKKGQVYILNAKKLQDEWFAKEYPK